MWGYGYTKVPQYNPTITEGLKSKTARKLTHVTYARPPHCTECTVAREQQCCDPCFSRQRETAQ